MTEVGATLREYRVGSDPVIDGFGVSDICPDGRGQLLAPWPNRLADGRYNVDGRDAQAALDEPAKNCAIHGLMRWLSWEPLSRAQNVVALGCTLNPQPGYPWRLWLSVEYRLGRAGLSVSTEVTNLDDHPAPFGLGFHPYITVGTTSLDAVLLHVPAKRRLLSDDRGIPTGETLVTGSEFDFVQTRTIGETRLDTAYTDLHHAEDGLCRMEVDDPRGRGVTVWMDENFRYAMVYTADAVQQASRRRRSIALEPMTCPPDALRSGVDLIRLEPGASRRAVWGISPRALKVRGDPS